MFFLAAHNGSPARVDIHGLHKLFLAVHALELDEDVAARWKVIFLVRLSFLHDHSRFSLQLFNLFPRQFQRLFSLLGLVQG